MKKNKKLIFSVIIIAVIAVVVKVFFFDFAIYKGENILPNVDGKTVLLLSKKANPESSDIVLINKPFTKEEIQVFTRCIAVAGDVIEIKNSEVFVNDIPEIGSSEIIKKYRVNCFSNEATNRLLNEYKLVDSVNLLGVYYLNLSNIEAETLKNDSIIKIQQIIVDKTFGNNDIFPFSYKYRWNEDNFGPLTIPSKGYKITLTDQSFSLYKNTIIYFENTQIEARDGKFYVGNNQITEFTFQNDYYFVMNDARYNYVDSRSWGMIPKSQIEATVVKRLK